MAERVEGVGPRVVLEVPLGGAGPSVLFYVSLAVGTPVAGLGRGFTPVTVLDQARAIVGGACPVSSADTAVDVAALGSTSLRLVVEVASRAGDPEVPPVRLRRHAVPLVAAASVDLARRVVRRRRDALVNGARPSGLHEAEEVAASCTAVADDACVVHTATVHPGARGAEAVGRADVAAVPSLDRPEARADAGAATQVPLAVRAGE